MTTSSTQPPIPTLGKSSDIVPPPTAYIPPTPEETNNAWDTLVNETYSINQHFGNDVSRGIMDSAWAQMDGMSVFFWIVLMAYFLPTIISFIRKHPLARPIGVVNLFIGWIFVVYVGCLIFSVWPFNRR